MYRPGRSSSKGTEKGLNLYKSHKMENGSDDRVYAAEKIMKKRIRAVSVQFDVCSCDCVCVAHKLHIGFPPPPCPLQTKNNSSLPIPRTRVNRVYNRVPITSSAWRIPAHVPGSVYGCEKDRNAPNNKKKMQNKMQRKAANGKPNFRCSTVASFPVFCSANIMSPTRCVCVRKVHRLNEKRSPPPPPFHQ